MAAILILTLGSRGDVQPYVALGAELKSRGHAVTVATGQGFEGMIRDHGLSSEPLSIDMQAMIELPEVQAAMTSLEGMTSLRAKRAAYLATRDRMQRQLDEMWAITRQIRPDIIVYNPKGTIAPYLARAAAAIAVPAFQQPAFAPTGAFANPLFRVPGTRLLGNKASGRVFIALLRIGYRLLLRPWLKRHPDVPARPGLDPLTGYHPAGSPVPRLYAHSGQIVPKPPEWGPHDHVTGYWFLPADKAWKPPAALAAFCGAGPPPVYVGFGSMPSGDAARTASIVTEALRRTGNRGILARGWGGLSDNEPSPHVHVLENAPHDWLFPRCSAVVHHGGAGTTHEGLRWGRPTLVCPVFGDQPFWGRMVQERGAGAEPLALRRLDTDGMANALTALRSPSIVNAAATLGERIRSEQGTRNAADLIEAVETRRYRR